MKLPDYLTNIRPNVHPVIKGLLEHGMNKWSIASIFCPGDTKAIKYKWVTVHGWCEGHFYPTKDLPRLIEELMKLERSKDKNLVAVSN